MIPTGLPNQFLCYGRTADGGKFPCDRAGRLVDAHNPENWMDYQTAAAAAAALGHGYGVAFDLTERDPWFFIDLDKCFDTASGQWKPEAVTIFNTFAGAWGEVSSSGTGLHIMGMCRVSEVANLRNKFDGWKEFYVKERFIAFGHTGWSRIGGVNADYDWTEVIKSVVPERVNLGDLPTGVDPRYTGPEDDDQLIELALRSSSGAASAVFGGRATFADLWNANADVLARNYPHPDRTRGGYDHSSADAALLSHLAFWTGRDMPRMDRLFRRSALMREKYSTRADYRTDSIQNAARLCRNVYDRPRTDAPVVAPAAAGSAQSEVLLTVQEQIEHFKGCIYIRDIHRVLGPDGVMMKVEVFNAMYGGHIFQMQPDGTGPTKRAFEAFTESRAWRFPKAIRPCFRPDLPFQAMLDDGSVNIYKKPDVVMEPGDVTPFLDHVARLLPDARDRAILLNYMAACVQYPGVKFQYAPVLQGMEGNGKTLVLQAVQYAVGKQYTHAPRASQITEKYNSYIEGKVFILVEEIHMEGRREILDELKTLITNVDTEIRGMAQEKRMAENRANLAFCTNYKNAVIKSTGDRRYAIFFTAQQTVEDLKRDGMTGDYFPKLFGWLKSCGWARVAHFLSTMQIDPQFDPSVLPRAPETSSTSEAITVSRGSAESELAEAAEDNTRGFRGGWASSWAIDQFLRGKGFRISRQAQVAMILSLGYKEWGRAPRPILSEDGKRPVLYCKQPGGTFEEYMQAQGYPS